MGQQRNGLPARGPGGELLGVEPKLPAIPGGPQPHQPEGLSSSEVFPGTEAESTIKGAPFSPAGAFGAPGLLPTGAPPPTNGGTPILPQLLVPNSFEELEFHAILVNSAREVTTVVEQTVAAGATGSTTVNIPANTVDITRHFREAGDGSISYSIEIDGVGRTAMASHRITGHDRSFARYFEKYSTVRIVFTNNDLVNPALLQIEWISLQIDSAKWAQYRNNLQAWSALLGIQI